MTLCEFSSLGSKFLMTPYVNKVNAKYVAEKPEESQKPWPPVTEIVDLYKPGGLCFLPLFHDNVHV